jgi:hypothetical protein
MDKLTRALLSQVETSLHRSHPEAAIGFGIHGIDGIRRERTGVGSVDRVTQQQPTRAQAGDSARLCTYPDMSMIDTDTMYEIALQRQVALRIPNGKTICLVVVDINARQ